MSDFSPGTQLLIDHRGGRFMHDPEGLERVIKDALSDHDISVLGAQIVVAPDRDGVTGAVLISQGHVAVQTWVDEDYASFDLLIPGDGIAKKVADTLARELLPDWTQIKAQKRNDFTPLPPAA